MQNRLLKNSVCGFTLIELLIVITCVCLFFSSTRHMYHLYRRVVLYAASDYMAATCSYLAQSARTHKLRTYLSLITSSSYSIYDGKIKKEYSLPMGVFFGPYEGVLGPPSRPTEKITSPLVGGVLIDGCISLEWDESGAPTPATCYIHAGEECCAISMSRAIVCQPTQWVLSERLWLTAG